MLSHTVRLLDGISDQIRKCHNWNLDEFKILTDLDNPVHVAGHIWVQYGTSDSPWCSSSLKSGSQIRIEVTLQKVSLSANLLSHLLYLCFRSKFPNFLIRTEFLWIFPPCTTMTIPQLSTYRANRFTKFLQNKKHGVAVAGRRGVRVEKYCPTKLVTQIRFGRFKTLVQMGVGRPWNTHPRLWAAH